MTARFSTTSNPSSSDQQKQNFTLKYQYICNQRSLLFNFPKEESMNFSSSGATTQRPCAVPQGRYKGVVPQHNATKLPSSSYKGVVPQHNGRWGAQIYEQHRRIWLGTFADETEAARAYDVAAERFRGRDATTNFQPLSESDAENASELAFLSAHSKTEIVDMLRKHTYNEELRHSRRNQQLGRSAGGRRTGTWSERELLFYKVVTPSDVGKLNRLVIPKQYAEKHFPLRTEENSDENNSNSGVLLNFEDAEGKVWKFRYSYWNSSQSYVLTKGWSRFVKEKGLTPGDVVSFWRYFDGSDMMQLLIDCKVAQPGEVPVASTSSSDVHMIESEDNDHHSVRLFGVNIGSTQTQAGSSNQNNMENS